MINPSSEKAVSAKAPSLQEANEKLEWTFSLFLPFADQHVEKLVISHQHEWSTGEVVPGTKASPTDNDNEDDGDHQLRETQSLLDRADKNSRGTCCWKYQTPMGQNYLESNILLKISYRPAWQGIPEYTSTLTRRRWAKTLLRYCCNSRRRRRNVEDNPSNDDPQQVWDVYTTSHIVKTEKIKLVIRGIGECHAMQVFIKPMYAVDNNLDYDTGNDGGSSGVDVLVEGEYENNFTQDGMGPIGREKPPGRWDAAYRVHRQKMGQGLPSADQAWTRFTEPTDSLSNADSSDESKDQQRYIILTFAMPMKIDTHCDPPLLWKVQLPPRKKSTSQENSVCNDGMMLDTITVLDGSLKLRDAPAHAYIQGYQSWSFTGSVSRGQRQPKPALPNLFSKAFNLGGSLPDPPTLVRPIRGSPDAMFYSKRCPPFYTSDFFTCISSTVPSSSTLASGKDEKYRSANAASPQSIVEPEQVLIDEQGGPALLCGWISQHQQFGVIAMDKDFSRLSMHASHNAQVDSEGRSNAVETDWAYGQLISPHHYDEEPMVHFLHSVAAHNQAKPLQNGPLLTGWCSWYHYYENITAANLRSNFSKLATLKNKVPTNVAVVDDGYMTAWGDWDSLKPGKFTDMAIVCRDIVAHGMKPGIWLAPFACDKHSKIAKKHPDWIIRNNLGSPANSSNCGKFFYGLDATNPQVRKHVSESIRRAVQDWGFEVLKIDFLYAACLEGNGKYDMSISRAQAMHLALQTIRAAAGPDVFLIGCGCPVGSGIGYVDGMRISADTGPTWYPALPLPWWDNGTLPSLRAMIRNSMSRAPFGHRWWHNDPDCLLLGETTSLTDVEVASAASIIAMTCGMMLLSDDLTKVSVGRMKIVTKIFPMTGVSATILDLHTTNNKGLPSIMRLWCTDRYKSMESFRNSESFQESFRMHKYNAEATHFGREASFNFDQPMPHLDERKRSCVHVAQGLGTWTIISLSNWQDSSRVMHIPKVAIDPPQTTGMGMKAGCDHDDDFEKPNLDAGYHVFSFWSSRYSWIPSQYFCSSGATNHSNNESTSALSRELGPHETEIFHIRPVTPGVVQYIGSDMHFSCGHEVLSFMTSTPSAHTVRIQLKNDLNRAGHVFLFVPVVDTSNVRVSLPRQSSPSVSESVGGRWEVVGSVPSNASIDSPSICIGRILRITMVVHGDGNENDGILEVAY